MELEHILEKRTADELRSLCKLFGKPKDPLTTKAHAMDFWCSLIRTSPRDFINNLDPSERLLLAEIAHIKELPAEAAFIAKYGVPYPKPSTRFDNRSKTSLLACLIHFDFRNDFTFLWDGIEVFRPLTAAPPAPTVRSLAEPPAQAEGSPVHHFEGEANVLLELGRVLRLVQTGRIKVSDKASRPTDASVRSISEVLVQPDFDLSPASASRNGWNYSDDCGPVRAHAWGVLIQQCGWTKSKKGQLCLTTAGTQILSTPTPEAFKVGVEGFIHDVRFDELHRINHIRGQTGKAKRWISDPGERRESISFAMEHLPAGEWIAFDEAFRFFLASDGVVEVESTNGYLYIGDAQYGHIYNSVSLFKQFTRAVIMESFATLGLVDIAYTSPHGIWPEFEDSYGRDEHEFLGRYDGLTAMRITALGAYCLGSSEIYSTPISSESPALHVLPNYEITALATPSPGTLSTLELLAVKVSDAVWKLDPETILRSVESGTSWVSLRTMLGGASRHEIPKNVETWFDDMEARAGKCLRTSEAVLLEWEDEAIAVTLANSSGIASLCYHAGGKRLVVPRKNLAAFTREARKRGHLLALAK